MKSFLTRVKFGVVGVLSIIIFSGAIFVGFSDTGPGLIKAVLLSILIIGYLIYKATLGHLTPRQDTILTGTISLLGFGIVAWEIFVNGDTVSRDDLVTWVVLSVAIAVIGASTLLPGRRDE
ncbi:hypothetical protein [Halorussus pelagicus]|uniref:hypothetical protein n=1 Tax=Halorussus pelagicus TaxID=2505977 RepID=UPI000FFB0EF2|nr:hypothetical protein [Halorussus pelagicus]